MHVEAVQTHNFSAVGLVSEMSSKQTQQVVSTGRCRLEMMQKVAISVMAKKKKIEKKKILGLKKNKGAKNFIFLFFRLLFLWSYLNQKIKIKQKSSASTP